MSAKSELVVSGAPSLKLSFQFYSHSLLFVQSFMQILLCCSSQQSTLLGFSPVSMRLRPKRTCSGVECFGGFHIKRFIFLRQSLT